MKEIWKDIQGYEGFYQVSNLGNVKSLHFGSKANHPKWESQPERLLKLRIGTSGYYRVELFKPGSRKTYYVHRLVADAFITNPLNNPEVNHIDGNKLNNVISNLEWVSKSENQKHAIKLGLRTPSPMMGKSGAKSPVAKPVIQYDLKGNFVNLWLCVSDAARSLNIGSTGIALCARSMNKTSYGFIWRYLTDDYIPMHIDV